jgi:hypothetical protein
MILSRKSRPFMPASRCPASPHRAPAP